MEVRKGKRYVLLGGYKDKIKDVNIMVPLKHIKSYEIYK